MSELQTIADALTGGAASAAQVKLDRFEKATKVILAASVLAALTGTIGLIIAVTRGK